MKGGTPMPQEHQKPATDDTVDNTEKKPKAAIIREHTLEKTG